MHHLIHSNGGDAPLEISSSVVVHCDHIIPLTTWCVSSWLIISGGKEPPCHCGGVRGLGGRGRGRGGESKSRWDGGTQMGTVKLVSSVAWHCVWHVHQTLLSGMSLGRWHCQSFNPHWPSSIHLDPLFAAVLVSSCVFYVHRLWHSGALYKYLPYINISFRILEKKNHKQDLFFYINK